MRSNMAEGKAEQSSAVSDVLAQPSPIVGRGRSASKLGNGATKARGNSLSIRSMVPETYTFPQLNYASYHDMNQRRKLEDLKEFPECTYRTPIDVPSWFNVLVTSYEICALCPGFLDFCSFYEFGIICTHYLLKKSKILHDLIGWKSPFSFDLLDDLPDTLIPPIVCDYFEQMGYCYEDDQVGVPFIKTPSCQEGHWRGRNPDIVDDDEYDDPYDGFFPFGEMLHLLFVDARNPQDNTFFVEDLFLDAPFNTKRIALRKCAIAKMSSSRRKNLPEKFSERHCADGPLAKICFVPSLLPQFMKAMQSVYSFVKPKQQTSAIWCYGTAGEATPLFSLEFELLASVPIVFQKRFEIKNEPSEAGPILRENEDPP